MKFKNFTREAVSELLTYLADNEVFASLKSTSSFSHKDAKAVLKDMASQLKQLDLNEIPDQKPDYEALKLSQDAMSLVSCLSPREEMLLFKSFKLL